MPALLGVRYLLRMSRQTQWIDALDAAGARTTLWRRLARPFDDAAPPALASWLVAAIVGAVSGLAGWALGLVVPHAVALILTAALWCGLELGLPERSVAARAQAFDRTAPMSGQFVVTFAVLLRVAALSTLPRSQWIAGLALATVIGRLQAVFLQFIADPLDEERNTTADYLTQPTSAVWFAALAAITLALATLAFGWRLALGMAIATVTTFVVGLLHQRGRDSIAVEILGVVVWLGELIALFAIADGHG